MFLTPASIALGEQPDHRDQGSPLDRGAVPVRPARRRPTPDQQPAGIRAAEVRRPRTQGCLGGAPGRLQGTQLSPWAGLSAPPTAVTTLNLRRARAVIYDAVGILAG